MRDFYHQGNRQLQSLNDSVRIADQLYRTRRREAFNEADAEIINYAGSFFLATATLDGWPDCSIKSGVPGFVRVINSTTLQFPDYDGNGMYRSLGNIKINPNVGLLFVQFEGAQLKLRVNGRAFITYDPDILQNYVGAKSVVIVEVRDIFPNCPRYTPMFSSFIESEFSPRANYHVPEPFWKSKPDLRPYLPKIRVADDE